MHRLPMGGGSARRVVMTYPPEGGGYTPGDTWEMYVGPDNLIQQLLWRRGAGKPIIVNMVIAKWLDYKKVGPLLVSLDHRGTGDGKPLRIFFTDVAVKIATTATSGKAHRTYMRSLITTNLKLYISSTLCYFAQA